MRDKSERPGMRLLHITETFPEIGPYVDCEVLGGWVYGHISDLGGFLPEDEAERLYPEAVAAWRARNDEIGNRSQGLFDEVEGWTELLAE